MGLPVCGLRPCFAPYLLQASQTVHVLTVDVAELQAGDFGATHTGAVENHQQGTPEQVPTRVNHRWPEGGSRLRRFGLSR
jgi:hypothetical protein